MITLSLDEQSRLAWIEDAAYDLQYHHYSAEHFCSQLELIEHFAAKLRKTYQPKSEEIKHELIEGR